MAKRVRASLQTQLNQEGAFFLNWPQNPEEDTGRMSLWWRTWLWACSRPARLWWTHRARGTSRLACRATAGSPPPCSTHKKNVVITSQEPFNFHCTFLENFMIFARRAQYCYEMWFWSDFHWFLYRAGQVRWSDHVGSYGWVFSDCSASFRFQEKWKVFWTHLLAVCCRSCRACKATTQCVGSPTFPLKPVLRQILHRDHHEWSRAHFWSRGQRRVLLIRGWG